MAKGTNAQQQGGPRSLNRTSLKAGSRTIRSRKSPTGNALHAAPARNPELRTRTRGADSAEAP